MFCIIRHPLEIILPFEFGRGIRFVGISGMSYHGGGLGIVIAAVVFCWKRGLNFWNLADLFSPISGKVVETNSTLKDRPQFVNEDPYGKGWLAVVEPDDVNRLPKGAIDAQSYLNLARQQAEAELKP